MIATLRPLTYDDLLEMPDDGQRYEIIGGELDRDAVAVLESPAGSGRDLPASSMTFARQSGEGKVVFAPFDVVLGPHDIVEPDLVFIVG